MLLSGRARGMLTGGLRVALLIAVSGCATTGGRMHQEGRLELKSRNYAEAARLLSLELERRPGDCMVRRDLGIALFKAGRYPEAVEHLSAAAVCLPGDGAALYYLGSAHEQNSEIEDAIATFQRSAEVRRFTRYRELMQERLKQLVRKQILVDARKRIAGEDTLSTRGSPECIALSPLDVRHAQQEYAPLGLAMAEWLTTDLAKLRSLRGVERLRLDAILTELHLPGIDPETAPQVGHLLGAGRVVSGGLIGTGGDAIRIELGVIDTETGETMPGISAGGEVSAFFSVEKDLVFSLIQRLGITPNALERAEIQQIPTRKLSAMLAYGKGLMAERVGDVDEAKAAYEEALAEDAGFSLANDALDALPAADATIGGLEETAEGDLLGRGGTGPDADETQDRLAETDRLVGSGLWPLDPNEVSPVPPTDQIPEPPPPPAEPPPLVPDPPPPPSGM